MDLSIIIPALNEAQHIAACVEGARRHATDVVVVDGGSDDDTGALAEAAGARVMTAARGRAVQQNAGAAAARGDTLLFLHADVRLPERAAAIVAQLLLAPGVAFGAFRTRHVPETWTSGLGKSVLRIADVRSRYSPLPYGDQALFLRKATFHRVGGFPEIPLMEDLAFSRRLRKEGALAVARESVEVSGRRFESALFRQALMINVFPALYYLGVPPEVLARLYGNPR